MLCIIMHVCAPACMHVCAWRLYAVYKCMHACMCTVLLCINVCMLVCVAICISGIHMSWVSRMIINCLRNHPIHWCHMLQNIELQENINVQMISVWILLDYVYIPLLFIHISIHFLMAISCAPYVVSCSSVQVVGDILYVLYFVFHVWKSPSHLYFLLSLW
jgi:hypothetical protein